MTIDMGFASSSFTLGVLFFLVFIALSIKKKKRKGKMDISPSLPN